MGLLIYFVFLILFVAGGWRMYQKAKQPGWAIFVPIYNLIVMMRILGRPEFWWLWMMIPIYNIYIWYLISKDMADSFGLAGGYVWIHFFLTPIFYMVAGFNAKIHYVGTAAAKSNDSI